MEFNNHNEDEKLKSIIENLEQVFKIEFEENIHNLEGIKNRINLEFDSHDLRVDTVLEDIEELIKEKYRVNQELVSYAVKETLKHFPELEGRNTRTITVAGHGTFKIDLDTGEFLGGKKYLYDDWVGGKLQQPEEPKPKKISKVRLLILTAFTIFVLGFTLTAITTIYQAITFSLADITSTGEYRFKKPQGYK